MLCLQQSLVNAFGHRTESKNGDWYADRTAEAPNQCNPLEKSLETAPRRVDIIGAARWRPTETVYEAV